MISKTNKTLTALIAGFSLTSVTHAATLVFTTNTTLTTASTVGANSDPGFQVRNGATLTIDSGGSLTQLDQTTFNQTTLLLGTIDGLESGRLVMNAGSAITGSENGGNNVAGILAYGSSVATINSGTITINEVGNPAAALNAVGFRAFGNSSFILNGGSFTINEAQAGNITPFTAADTSLIEIYGGTWNFLEGLNPNPSVLGFTLSGTATVNLYGSFNFGIGSIAANTGTITGTLQNGDPFNLAFDKTAGGTINIIPEPQAALLGGLGLLALLRRRRN